MKACLQRFLRDPSGAAGAEEAVLLTGIALVVIPTASTVGTKLVSLFESLTRALH